MNISRMNFLELYAAQQLVTAAKAGKNLMALSESDEKKRLAVRKDEEKLDNILTEINEAIEKKVSNLE